MNDSQPDEHQEHQDQWGGRRGRPPITEHEHGGRRARRRSSDHPSDRPDRGRMRRGDVRVALLIALLDGPAHGYELIELLDAKTEGRWRPSPGSVYPTLQLLADQGLVTSTEHDGKRVFEITDDGRAHAQERISAQGYPWASGRGGHGDLRVAMRDLHLAAKQVGVTGSDEAVARAIEIVTEARKALYRLLADA